MYMSGEEHTHTVSFAADSGITRQDSVSLEVGVIPRLHDIRRIPARYCTMLPLSVMQHNRCAVVGVARGVLTLAVVPAFQPSFLALLAQFTGYTIFPVHVQPERMDVLLRRIERRQQHIQRYGVSILRQEMSPAMMIELLLALYACVKQVQQ